MASRLMVLEIFDLNFKQTQFCFRMFPPHSDGIYRPYRPVTIAYIVQYPIYTCTVR